MLPMLIVAAGRGVGEVPSRIDRADRLGRADHTRKRAQYVTISAGSVLREASGRRGETGAREPTRARSGARSGDRFHAATRLGARAPIRAEHSRIAPSDSRPSCIDERARLSAIAHAHARSIARARARDGENAHARDSERPRARTGHVAHHRATRGQRHQRWSATFIRARGLRTPAHGGEGLGLTDVRALHGVDTT